MKQFYIFHSSKRKLFFLFSIFSFVFTLNIFSQNIIYVKADASGGASGSSWIDAYTNLQTALDNAVKGDSIWVAAATYKPFKDATGNSSPADNRTKTFQLIDSVSLFGGFAGTETNFNDRDWETNETILSGDIGTVDDSTDNCYHVIIAADSLTIDGFSIVQGSGNTGAGININHITEMLVSHCTFRSNYNTENGGGIYIDYYSDNIIVDSCIFINNSANRGGGIYNSGSDDTIKNCLFISNSAVSDGAAISHFSCTSLVTHCTFYKNTDASAINNEQAGTYTTTNSIFLENSSGDISNGWNSTHVETYNCLQQSGFAGNNGNIDNDPMLYVFGETDIRIHEKSPCIDAGDPASPLDSDGTQTDMGFSHVIFTPAKDASVVEMISPASPLVYGTKDIQVKITNFGSDNLTSVNIEWEVDGTPQFPYAWTGTLAVLDTSSAFVIGNYNFTPGDHQIKIYPNLTGDEFNDNDTLETTVSVIANMDAGVTSLNKPASRFNNESSTDVYVSVKNYNADSSIYNLKIGWLVDGINQTAYNYTDTIFPNQTIDSIKIASYSFSRGEHNIKIWTFEPNGLTDDDNSNDTITETVYSILRDIGVASIQKPNNPDSIGTIPIIISYKNYCYEDDITYTKIFWQMNSEAPQYYEKSGTVSPGETSEYFEVGNYNFTTTGTYHLKVWTTSPNGNTDDYHNNDTLTKDIVIGYPMSGVYTIGATGDIANFSDAVDSLINKGVNGAVIFNVESNTYNEQIAIPEILGISEQNTITFQSATGDSTDVILSNTGGGYTVSLDGADYIIFKNMTISTDASGSVLELKNEANYNQIMNCQIIGAAGSETLIYVSYQNNQNNIFFGNRIVNGTKGIYLDAFNKTITGTEIKENVFENQSGQAINLYRVNGAIISSNIITSNSSITGIYLSDCDDNFTIEKNKILLSGGGSGIYFYNGTNNTNTPDRIANNFIYINTSSGDYGIYNLSDYRNMDISHNSINITGNATGSSNIYIPSQYPIYNLKDNILINKAGGTVIGFSQSSSNYTSDYNCLYSNGVNLANTMEDLRELQSNTGQDMHSFSVDPNFISDSDLHTFSPYLNNQGTPIAEITTDIDGEARDGTNPDIGADEYDPLPGLSATYDIGSSAPLFKTFNEAVDSLIAVGVDGSVIFNVQDGTYNEQLSIPEIANASTTNTITFQSASSDSTKVILTYAASGDDDNYTLKLDGADYVTFKNITLQATGTTYARIVEIGSKANYNTLSNNHLIGVINKSELVYSYNYYSYSYDTSNVFTNNLFSNGIRGINMTGGGSNPIVSGNEFVNQSEEAIYLKYYKYIEILSNYIHSEAYLSTAIFLENNSKQAKVNNNQIILPYGGNGVRLRYCSLATNDTSEIFNNHIYINTETLADIRGISTDGLAASYIKIYYNSVNITGNNSSSTCYYYSKNESCTIKLFNNNFSNKSTGITLGVPSHFGIVSNYNNFYTNGAKLATNSEDLKDLQSDYGQDQNSVSVNPYFVEDTTYHVLNPALNGAGILLSEVSEDLDGDIRDATNPDIGADEFTPAPVPLHGTYTIAGITPDYETINDAVQDLIINGVDAAVIFNIATDTLTEQVSIPEISGASVSNAITFQSATGDSSDVLITYTPINTAHKSTVCLDGADYITFKKLSITTGEEWGYAIELKSEATHNKFEANKIFLASQSAANYDYSLVYAKASADSNNVFVGNRFENGSTGIHLEDCVSNIQITNNKFVNISHRGIYLINLRNPKITENYIDISYASSGAMGIELGDVSSDGTEKSLIANNMIHTISSYGMYIYNSNDLSIVYNTVKVDAGSNSFKASGNNNDILNNIFVINQGNYAAEISDTTNCNIDYNLYYNPNADYAEMYYSTGHTTDLEQYGFDLHSKAREPQFVSDTDLHTTDPWLNNWGTPISGINTDIDGESRDLANTDVGADEFDGIMPFEGEYTIGATGDFKSFTEAIDTITPVGISASVIFKVQNGVYNEHVIIPDIPEVSESKTITFTSLSGDSTDVTLQFDATNTSDNYIIKMDSCSYITFQNITLKALNTTYATVITLNNGAKHNNISNNVVAGNGTASPVINSDGKENNYNKITNNIIKNGNVGIMMYGESTSIRETGTEIIGNTFENQNNITIALKWNSSSNITKNKIKHPELVNGQWSGIYLTECNTGLIANNVISFNTNTMSGGIVLSGSSNQKVYYNSINIIGSTNDSRVFSQQEGGSSNYVYNNIFSNKSGGLVLYIRDINSITCDNNNYYSTGDKFNYYGVSDTEFYWISDLETWQTDYSKDLNTVSVDPQFVSDTDLLPANIVLDGSGKVVADVTVDIDGYTRDTENPDIGAYEFNGCSNSGTFTIGATGADYPTFKDAIESLQTCWVEGSVTFNVQSGTYNEQVIIPEISRLSETNTVTFQSASGDSTDVILTYESSNVDTNYTVKLDGADFIIFKNMTIKATGTDYANVIEISGGASNNQFINNQFIGVNTTDASQTNGVLIYSPNINNIPDTSNIISKNLFLSGSHGIYLSGHYSYTEKNNQISENSFENQISYAMYLSNQNNTLISKNKILNTSSDKTYYGVYFTGIKSVFSKNKININNDYSTTRTGLYFQSDTNSMVSNNFIHMKAINPSGYGVIVGMELFSCKAYYNSVNITGSTTYSFAAKMIEYGDNYCVLKNNILANNAGGRAIRCGTAATANVVSDYNNLYSNGEYLATVSNNIVDIAAWRTTTSLDANSISVNPHFGTELNLYTQDPIINGGGTPLTEVTDDINGDTRDTATPDIGADEFTQTAYMLNADTIHTCAYDTISLDAGNGYDTYSWSNGADTQFTDIDTAGIGLNSIKLISTVSINGQEYTDSLWVSFHKPVALVSDVDTCSNSTVILVASGGVSYDWYGYSSNHTSSQSVYINNEIQNYIVTVYDAYGCIDKDTASITPYDKPSFPYISLNNDSLQCSVTGTKYDWYLNSTIMQNTTQTIDPPQSGSYQVIVYNHVCPSDISDIYEYTEQVGIGDFEGNLEMTLYPNPVNGVLFVDFGKSYNYLKIDIISSDGKQVFAKLIKNVNEGDTEELHMEEIPSGLYFIRFSNNNISRTARIIVQ